MKSRLCSLKRPLCVQSSSAQRDLQAPLHSLERAYEEHVFGSELGRPVADDERPLLWHVDERQELRLEIERIPSRGFDRARGRCVGGYGSLEIARRCVAEAALVSHAPAAAPWLRAGLAASAARAMGAAPESHAALREAYQNPELGVFTSSRGFRVWQTDEWRSITRLRSQRFFDYLERRSEKRLGLASWLGLALGATRTPAGASRWEGEPDIMEVLLATLSGDVTRVARAMDDFAMDDFFAGRERGTPVHLSWRLDGATLPRNVAIAHPLEPTGSAYVWVDLTEEQRGQVMAFKMSCEAPVSYVWSVARLDKDGNEIAHVPVAYRQRGRTAATRVEPEEGTVSLLVVGTNMGGIDMAHPFDPDHEPHEAHACGVYASVMPSGAATDGAEPKKH